MVSQVPGHPWQGGSKSFRADVVQSLPYDTDGIVDQRAIGASSLLATGLAFEIAMHEPDEALAVQSRHPLHLVQ
jgi:hypothetical protein